MGTWRATIFRDNAVLPADIRQAIDEGLTRFRMEQERTLVGRNDFHANHTDGTEIIQRVFATGFTAILPTTGR